MKAKVRVHKVKPGKQSLDMQMVSYLGYCIGDEDKEGTFILVSKDTDYANTVLFWQEEGVEVKVQPAILEEKNAEGMERALRSVKITRRGRRGGRKTAAAVQEAESAIPAASSADPQMDGTANAGSATTWSRGDHVHPSDTSRVPTTRTVNGKALSADLVLDAVGSITLSLSWSGSGPYTQVVTVTGATISSNSKVDLQPTPAQIEQLISDGVEALVIENNAGTLTATAIGAAPSTALTLQCTVTEVSA